MFFYSKCFSSKRRFESSREKLESEKKHGDVEHRVKLLREFKALKKEGCTNSEILAMVPEMKPLIEVEEGFSSE